MKKLGKKKRSGHSPFPWQVEKDKHGIDASRHVVAYLPNGNEDMTLVITSSEAGDPLADAELICRSVSAFALIESVQKNFRGT